MLLGVYVGDMATTEKHVSLLPAGCQLWSKQVCTAFNKDWFAYAATLAVYIYEVRFIHPDKEHCQVNF